MHSRPQPKRFGWIIGHTEGICCFRVARRVGMGWGGRSSGSRRRSFSCTLVAALRASAAIARLPIPQRARPVANASQIQRAAAAPLSSGRVLKAMAAWGAVRWTALTTASNRTSRLGGRRTPAPITTQS